MGVMGKGCPLVINEGIYYGSKIALAAVVDKEELDGGEREVVAHLTGTQSEELLKPATEPACRSR